MRPGIAFFTEGDASIGAGHLKEAIALAECAQEGELQPVLVIPEGVSLPGDWPAGLKILKLSEMGPRSLEKAARQLASQVQVAVTNFRQIEESQIQILAQEGLRVICLDEWGGRKLRGCLAVVNPSPNPDRHRYGSPAPKLYTGLDYLPLEDNYRRLHPQERENSGPIRSLVLSLGAADRSGATLRVLEALSSWSSFAQRHLVIGPFFKRESELLERVRSLPGSWRVHRHPSSLSDLLSSADVGICAGGNTLCEMACVGTPAIVLYEDPHEREQGIFFERQGFGFCLGPGTSFEAASLLRLLDRLEDPQLRCSHRRRGKDLVDGQGALRICRIAVELTAVDSPLAA